MAVGVPSTCDMVSVQRLLPNLLSALRIGFALSLLPAAAVQQPRAFWALLVACLLSDALDGLLARRWGTTSDLGRRLDSAGDYVLVLALLPSLFWLWPELIWREIPWFGVAVLAYFAPTVWSVLRWRTIPGLHTLASKASAVGMAFALPLLLLGGPPLPFRGLAILQVLVAAEEFAIIHFLPGWSGVMPSYWHARRHVREAAT